MIVARSCFCCVVAVTSVEVSANIHKDGAAKFFSDNRFLPGRALTQKITNDNKTCRDACSHVQGHVW